MKKFLVTKPLWASAIVFIALFAIVVFLSTIVFTSWANHLKAGVVFLTIWFLYGLEGKNLSELGLTSRLFYLLPVGLGIGILYFCMLFGLQMLQNNISIHWHSNINWGLIFNGLWFLLGSVLIEEFIFRGYCFKKTYEQIGALKANLIFGFLFMVYHWFALNAWGNWAAMLGLVTTAFGHILFATAFIQSRTLFLPIGIHLGNNWAQRHFFAIKNMGIADTTTLNDSLFSITVVEQQASTGQVLGSYFITFMCFLLTTYLIWKWYNRNTPLSISLILHSFNLLQ
jgi:membrane protease YdiL (CAAX protease family)